MFKRFLLKLFSVISEKRRFSRVEVLRNSLIVYVVIFVFWGLYRLLLPFPIIVEEFIIKPLVFFPPLLYVLRKEKVEEREVFSVFGFRSKGLLYSAYLGMTLGFAYLFIVIFGRLIFSQNMVLSTFTISQFSLFTLVLVSLATALWEQMVFSGFLLGRFVKVFGDEWSSVLVTSFMFMLLHLPILWIEFHSNLVFIFVQLLILFLVGYGNSILMLRTRNILAPILSHSFWALSLGLLK